MKQKLRKQFLTLLIALLQNGFSIQESLQVIQRTGQFPAGPLETFTSHLQNGLPMGACFEAIGFNQGQVLQINLADSHGDLPYTLATILQHMELFEKQKKEIQKVASYPMLLLIFVFTLLFSMRFFLLPSLLDSGAINQQHWGVRFINYGPFVLLGVFLFILMVALLIHLYFRKKSVIERGNFIMKIPLVRSLFAVYQTSYFALEWGKLFKQGLEAQQIVEQMNHIKGHLLLIAVANEVHEGMNRGGMLSEQLTKYSFLMKEFPLIIYQGEIKGRLGEELLLYSQLLLTNLVAKIEKGIQWIQPVIFLFVAVLILAIYMAMLLPMYENIGGSI